MVKVFRAFAIIATLFLAAGTGVATAQTYTGTLTFNAVVYNGVAAYDTNISHYWGLSAVSAAAASANVSAADLCNGSSCTGANLCTGVKVLASGALDVTSGLYCNGGTQTVTAWCSTNCVTSGTARVINLYDQVGTANATNTYTNAPDFILSGLGSKPTVGCRSSNYDSLTATITSLPDPLTVGMSFEQNANFTGSPNFVGGTGGFVINPAGVANQIGGAAAGGAAYLVTTAANGTGVSDFSHGHNVVFGVASNGATGLISVDGATAVTGSTSYGSSTGTSFTLCEASTNYADIYFGKVWLDGVEVTTTVAQNSSSLTNVPLP